mgnify:CR=1 FL=1
MGMDEEVKLLFENWRKYLNESQDPNEDWEPAEPLRWAGAPPPPPPAQEPHESDEPSEPEEYVPLADDPIVHHNEEMLGTNPPGRGPDAVEKFNLWDLSREELIQVVGSIPPLRTNKILKVIGSGTKKIAYKLDNDHIFSLFQTGYGGDEYDDLDWYAGIQGRQFKGESSVDEPAIHDYGEVPFPDQSGRGLKYVEMSGIVPLSDGGPPSLGALAEIDMARLDWDIVQIAKFVEASLYHGALIKDSISLDKKVELVQHWWRNRKGLPFAGEEDLLDLEVKGLSPDLTMNLIKTLVRLAVRLGTTHVLQDVHPGNLGMSIENPDEFVVIDI